MPVTEDDLPDFDQWWDYENPAETEARFRTLLPRVRDAHHRSYRVQLLTQIARAQGLQQHFAAAHKTLDSVKTQMADDFTQARIRYLLERGRVFNSANDQHRAKEFFVQAWELAMAHDEDALAIDAAHMVAIVEPPDEQLSWNQRALQLAEWSVDPRAQRWMGSLYNNIGWTYHDQGRYDDALATFIKAMECREQQGQAREARTARWCVARVLRSLGRIDEALALQNALLADLESAGEADSFVHEEIGECLLKLDRQAEARPYFQRAHELLSADPWIARDEPEHLSRLKDLGETRNHLG